MSDQELPFRRYNATPKSGSSDFDNQMHSGEINFDTAILLNLVANCLCRYVKWNRCGQMRFQAVGSRNLISCLYSTNTMITLDSIACYIFTRNISCSWRLFRNCTLHDRAIYKITWVHCSYSRSLQILPSHVLFYRNIQSFVSDCLDQSTPECPTIFLLMVSVMLLKILDAVFHLDGGE